jgi:hypothetical protein
VNDDIVKLAKECGGWRVIESDDSYVLTTAQLAAFGQAYAKAGGVVPFALEQSTIDTEHAKMYRYLREGTNLTTDGPCICTGMGDLFDYLQGDAADEAVRAAMIAAGGGR